VNFAHHGDVWMPIRPNHGGWRDTQLARAHVQAAARALGVRVATRRVGSAIHGVVGDDAARAATRQARV